VKNITARHKRFVEAYCEHFNGARAAREAGYAESRDRQTAHRLLQDPDISQMVEARLDDLAMSAAEATKRLGDIARGDISDFFKVGEVETDTGTKEVVMLDKDAVLEDGGAVVKELTFDANGRPKLKLYDKQKALKTILDAHGEFNHEQNVDITSGGDQITTIDFRPPSDSEPDSDGGD
jgi:phage terminase small subunit